MNTNINVVWKPIPHWPLYEVSNEGEVRSWKVRGKEGVRASRPSRVTPFWHHGDWWVRLNAPGVRISVKLSDLVKKVHNQRFKP